MLVLDKLHFWDPMIRLQRWALCVMLSLIHIWMILDIDKCMLLPWTDIFKRVTVGLVFENHLQEFLIGWQFERVTRGWRIGNWVTFSSFGGLLQGGSVQIRRWLSFRVGDHWSHYGYMVFSFAVKVIIDPLAVFKIFRRWVDMSRVGIRVLTSVLADNIHNWPQMWDKIWTQLKN